MAGKGWSYCLFLCIKFFYPYQNVIYFLCPIVADIMFSSFFPFALWNCYAILYICPDEFHDVLH